MSYLAHRIYFQFKIIIFKKGKIGYNYRCCDCRKIVQFHLICISVNKSHHGVVQIPYEENIIFQNVIDYLSLLENKTVFVCYYCLSLHQIINQT